MKVLIIPSWYATRSYKNLGSFFWEEAIALYKFGVDVTFLNIGFAGRKDYLHYFIPKIDIYECDGIKVIDFITPSFGLFNYPRLVNLISKYKLKYLLLKKILIIDFDIIHAHSYIFAGYLANYLKSRFHIPYVITEQSSDLFENNINKYKKSILVKVVEESKFTFCVSKKLKDVLYSRTNNISKLHILPYMPNSIFQFKKKLNSEYFTYIYIGRLDNNKRADLTIEAFYKAFKQNNNNNIRLFIAGSGVNKQKLENQIKNLEVENQVKLLGQISRIEVRDLLWEGAAFVMPSFNETFGLVYVEALATGTPIIGVYNGGADDIINENNGYIVERDSVSKLSDAMIKMVNEYDNFNLKKISEETIIKYGEKSHIEKLIKFYKC